MLDTLLASTSAHCLERSSVTNIIVESNVTGVFRAREGCSVTLQNELSWQMAAASSSMNSVITRVDANTSIKVFIHS